MHPQIFRRTAASSALLALVLTGCSSADESVTSAADIPSAPTTATTSPTPSPTPSPTRTPTPTSTEEAEPEGARVSYSCGFGFTDPANYENITISKYQDAWKHAKRLDTTEVSCSEGELVGGELTATERKALKTAYGTDAEDEKIVYLHQICSNVAGTYIDKVASGAQAKELSGAVQVCPDHPKIDSMHAAVASGQGLIEQEAARTEAMENGTFIASRDTPYRVGAEIQPGTYRTTGQFTDCYWEISDAAGNIIDNNFATFATDITVTIPPTAAGFTSNSCGGWMKIG